MPRVRSAASTSIDFDISCTGVAPRYEPSTSEAGGRVVHIEATPGVARVVSARMLDRVMCSAMALGDHQKRQGRTRLRHAEAFDGLFARPWIDLRAGAQRTPERIEHAPVHVVCCCASLGVVREPADLAGRSAEHDRSGRAPVADHDFEGNIEFLDRNQRARERGPVEPP